MRVNRPTPPNQLRVHLAEAHDHPLVARLRELLDESIVLTAGDISGGPRDFHILVCGTPSREDMTASPGLHTLVIPWSGLPVKTRDLLLEFPQVRVHNIHYNAEATAETAIALMLAAAKRLIPIDRSFRNHDWTPRYAESSSRQLAGGTALVLGYGAIGQLIARACRGLGMNVLAVNRSGRSPDDWSVYPVTALDTLLPQAQVLQVALPRTPATDAVIGAEQLARLPDEAIVVNVSRGRVIEEATLFAELKSGRLRAGIDVWYQYPQDKSEQSHTKPSAFPFHELDNVAMTPHLAGHNTQTEENRARHLAALLNAAAGGETVPNRVDPSRGY